MIHKCMCPCQAPAPTLPRQGSRVPVWTGSVTAARCLHHPPAIHRPATASAKARHGPLPPTAGKDRPVRQWLPRHARQQRGWQQRLSSRSSFRHSLSKRPTPGGMERIETRRCKPDLSAGTESCIAMSHGRCRIRQRTKCRVGATCGHPLGNSKSRRMRPEEKPA